MCCVYLPLMMMMMMMQRLNVYQAWNAHQQRMNQYLNPCWTSVFGLINRKT